MASPFVQAKIPKPGWGCVRRRFRTGVHSKLIARARLKNQIRQLFACTVSLML